MTDRTRGVPMDVEFNKRAAELRYVTDKTWYEIAQVLSEEFERDDVTSNAARCAARRYNKKFPDVFPETAPTEEEVIQEAYDDDVLPGEEGVWKTDGANDLYIASAIPLVTTLEEQIEHCKVDMDVWYVYDHQIRTYQTQAKREEKDITYDGGKIVSGRIKKGGIYLTQMVYVKAWYKRRELKEVHPTIKAIRYVGEIKKPEPPPSRPFTRRLILADPHVGFRRRVTDAKLTPFHNRAVLDVILQIAAYCKPDIIDVLGDILDSAEWTDKFLKSPEFWFTFQPALSEAHWWLLNLSQICEDVRAHQGNHDARIPNSIKRNMPFAYGLRTATMSVTNEPSVLSLEYLLELNRIGVKWFDGYPNDGDWMADGLKGQHGEKTSIKSLSVPRALAKGNVSILQAHNHRGEFSTDKDKDGKMTVGVTTPCTCWTDCRVPGHRASQTWNNGLIILDVFDNRYYQPFLILIDDRRGIYGGKMFVARDEEEIVSSLRGYNQEWNW